MAFLCTCSKGEIMNSGNDNIYLQFWRTTRNLILIRSTPCIILITRQLRCLLCPEENIVYTRFAQRFLLFSRPQTAQIIPQKLRLKDHNLLYEYNPASEAILQKRKPRSNHHIIEIMCCLCIFYDWLIISDKPLLWSLFIRSLYWNSYYLCIMYMALWK